MRDLSGRLTPAEFARTSRPSSKSHIDGRSHLNESDVLQRRWRSLDQLAIETRARDKQTSNILTERCPTGSQCVTSSRVRNNGAERIRSYHFEPPLPHRPSLQPLNHLNTPSEKRGEKSTIPLSLIAVNVSTPSTNEPLSGATNSYDASRVPGGETHSERLMSPSPTREPKSIIKQGCYRSMKFDQIEQHSDSPMTSASQESEETYQSQRSKSIKFHELPEQARLRIMKENLEKHRRSRAPVTTKPPTTSFNGPFFKLEETNIPRSSDGTLSYGGPTCDKDYSEEQFANPTTLAETRTISASEAELSHIKDSSLVVIWPPPSDETPRSQSVIPKTMTDPDRIDEYRRQKNMEEEAMRRHEEEKLASMTKQMRAMEIQQQRLYEQRNAVGSPVLFIDNDVTTSFEHQPLEDGRRSTALDEGSSSIDSYQQDFSKESSRMRVYEAAPISVVSDERSNRDSAPPRSTWKRTYTVEKPLEVAKNEILTSGQLLEKDQYHVDILKRRAAFVEKPEKEPEIVRTGRRWQPPPDKPYVWPSFPRAVSVDLEFAQNDYNQVTSPFADNAEHRWIPVVNDPGYKREEKNFTPMNSPPSSPDGSHRPKPAFRKERRAPSGGFYPHAPNAIKVVKRRSVSSQGLLTTVDDGHHSPEDNVEVIHQNNYRRLDEGMNEWDKIYDLPPHSSTIVGKDVPKNVNVKRRLSHFEGSVQNLQRRQESAQKLYSVDGSRYGSIHSMSSPPTSGHHSEPMHISRKKENSQRNSQRKTMTGGNSGNSTYAHLLFSPFSCCFDSCIVPCHSHRQQYENSIPSFSHTRSVSTTALSPVRRSHSPAAIRVRTKIGPVTTAGPSPASYERVKAYHPHPLSSGHRFGDLLPDPKAFSPSPGHTRRMIHSVTESTKRLDRSKSSQPFRDHKYNSGSQYL